MQKIEFKQVSKFFGNTQALQHINLCFDGAGIHCIIGLSGSGKSTLLRHINCLLSPNQGEVWVNGKNLADLNARELQYFRQQQVAMVFQQFALFPHLNVLENIAYGLKVKGEARLQRLKKAQEWVEEVGLQGKAFYLPCQLSGGEQQRVGIARAFACDTPILLMDEPFSALDPINRRSLQALLITLQRRWQKSVIFVTHDLEEVKVLSDNVVLMKDGQIIQQGTFQALLTQPINDYVAQFMRSARK